MVGYGYYAYEFVAVRRKPTKNVVLEYVYRMNNMHHVIVFVICRIVFENGRWREISYVCWFEIASLNNCPHWSIRIIGGNQHIFPPSNFCFCTFGILCRHTKQFIGACQIRTQVEQRTHAHTFTNETHGKGTQHSHMHMYTRNIQTNMCGGDCNIQVELYQSRCSSDTLSTGRTDKRTRDTNTHRHCNIGMPSADTVSQTLTLTRNESFRNII